MRKGKRKRSPYIKYDYQSTYRDDIDLVSEQQMLDLLKRGRGSIYATKEIRSGEQLELEIFPEFTRSQKRLIPDETRKEKQRKAERNRNKKNSRKMCERVINANFGDEDIWATLTYTDENMPSSMEEAKKNMKKYIDRLNYRRKKMGLTNARYVYVTECSKKGRWHHHIVMDGDMPMDLVESVWKAGKRNEVRRLHKDKDGLTGMARYITKPPEEKKGKDEGKGQKSWTPSKGLKRPEEKTTHYKIKNKDVASVVRDREALPEILNKWFGKDGYEFNNADIRYNNFNGRFYIYARMHKENTGGEERTHGKKKNSRAMGMAERKKREGKGPKKQRLKS